MKTTETMKHTPGPWRTQRSHSGRVIYKETQRDFETKETRMLAFMVRNEDQFPVEESDANARLIAAAPDYHAWTNEVLEFCDEMGSPAWKDLMSRGRAIKSKAEGAQ